MVKRALFIIVALMLGMSGILFLLPFPPWAQVLISGIYGGAIGLLSMKIE
jgi:uncharacterized membrane protein YjjP (DUF1212 family)